jgi:hypothetical protein
MAKSRKSSPQGSHSKPKTKGKNMNKKQIIEEIESRNERSAWGRGVKDFAVDLLGNIESDTVTKPFKGHLNIKKGTL